MIRVETGNINTREYWDRRYATGVESMWKIWTTHDLVAKIAAHIPPSARVLDVGCGAGIIPWRINELRVDIRWAACDFSEESVKYLRALPSLDFEHLFCGDVSAGLPCADASYDVVLCTEVLEHLDRPEVAVREMARVAGQRLVVSVPNGNAIAGPEHVWNFDADDLHRLLAPYGPTSTETARHGRNLIAVCRRTK